MQQLLRRNQGQEQGQLAAGAMEQTQPKAGVFLPEVLLLMVPRLRNLAWRWRRAQTQAQVRHLVRSVPPLMIWMQA